MFGGNLSDSTLPKKYLPHVAAIKCSCHMIYLCASHGCLKLSITVEDLCRNIYSQFSRSTLRQKDFTQFQEFVQAQPHKMLNLSQTRWMSLESCVTRIRLYFIVFVADGKDPSYTTESILKGLSNKFLLAQLELHSCTVSTSSTPCSKRQHQCYIISEEKWEACCEIFLATSFLLMWSGNRIP